jgi:hypothetical protein
MPLRGKSDWVPGPHLIHGGGVNAKIPNSYYNAQDPQSQGGHEFRKQEQPYHRTVAIMSLNGCTDQEIAKAVDRTPGTVSQIRKQPYCQKAMIELQQQAGLDELKRIIQEGGQAVVRVAKRAKDPNQPIEVRQRDDHILVRSLVRVVEPEDSNRPFLQLTDAELTEIILKQQAVEVESQSTPVIENEPPIVDEKVESKENLAEIFK